MSSINSRDQNLINQLKKKIEEVSGLPSPEHWKQKDFDFLVYFIEEKSGVRISLSTLKRIWKNENNRLPHISTLDALSRVAFQKEWLSFKSDSVSIKPNETAENRELKKNFAIIGSALIGFLILAFLSYGYFKKDIKKPNLNIENVQFTARTSVQNKVPNSVVFDYDISEVSAEKFFLQQSWDKSRRVEISKMEKQRTDIYHVPGFYFAKLFADSTKIAETPVHIKTEDWFITSNPMKTESTFDKSQWLSNGTLGVPLEKLVSDNERPEIIFYNSKDFKTDGDNFTYSSSFKMDSLSNVSCPKMSIIIKGVKDYLFVQVIEKGCESDAYLKISEKEVSGKINDLTMLGVAAYNWQNIKVEVKNKVLKLLLNNTEVYQNEYVSPIGELKEITHVFSGWGSLDNVELKDAKGSFTFVDNFN